MDGTKKRVGGNADIVKATSHRSTRLRKLRAALLHIEQGGSFAIATRESIEREIAELVAEAFSIKHERRNKRES